MSTFTVTSANRGAAKRLLNTWHDSRKVRSMTLIQLQQALHRAVNETWITGPQVIRALEKRDKVQAGHAGQAQDVNADGEDDGNNPEGVAEQDDNAGEQAAENRDLDDGQAGNGNGESEEGDGDGGSESESDDADAQAQDDHDAEEEALADQEEQDRQDSEERRKEEQERYEKETQERHEKEKKEKEEAQRKEDEEYAPLDEDEEIYHPMYEVICKYIKAGLNVALIGPAGTGKSRLAAQIAIKLEKKLYVNGALMSKYDLIGYVNQMTDTYHETPAYIAFTQGGLHLFDELDASSPEAVVAYNGITDDQGRYTFPCGQKEKHDDYVSIATLNTWAMGATADYVGRFKQDAAAMNRFVKVHIDYDIVLEKRLGPKDIVKRVHSLRAAVNALGIRHIVSTRQIIFAAKAREAGVSKSEIDRDIFFAGLDEDTLQQVKAQMKRGDQS